MKKILLLSIAMFALGLDAYIVSGLLPAISQEFNVSASAVGQMVTVFTLCYALSAPICATLLAGRSARQILLIAMTVFIIANAATALVSSFSQLLLVRAFAGAGAGLFSPTAAAAAVALAPPEKRGRAIGFILGGMGVGTVIGVPLGLLLAEHTQWQNVFLIVSLLGFISAVGIGWKFPSIKAKSTPSLQSRVRMLLNPKVAETVAITVMISIASLGLYTYLAPIIHDAIRIQSIAPYLWAWGVGGIVGSFSVGPLIDLTGKPKRLLVVILLIMSASMLVLPHVLTSSVIGFLPFFLWGATGWSSQAPQQHALMSIEPEHGAIVVALNSSANYLGSAIGAALGGVALGLGVMPECLPYIAGAIVLIACGCQIFLARARR